MSTLAWHRAWSEVAGDAVRDAVATLRLRPAPRVLDLGAAIGLAWPALSSLGGHVTAIDLDSELLEASRPDATARGITQVQGDVLTWLDGEPRFDLIWAGDVLWHNYFPEPLAVVRRLIDALVPGGCLAVFTANWYSSRFLWTHPDLERRLLTANARRWGIHADGDLRHHEQAAAWLSAAGAHEVTVSLHPIMGHPQLPGWPAWRHYLETCVWPDYLAAAGHDADGRDRGELLPLITPGGSLYLPASPGYLAFQPTQLVSGRRRNV